MWQFVLGLLAGVVSVVGFLVYNATQPERLAPMLVHMFQLMRLHLGRNSAVIGVTGPHGWKIGIWCCACGVHTGLAKDATTYVCEQCHRSFRETGTEMGGTGRNEAIMRTET